MDFIRAIINESDIVTDEEVEQLLEDLKLSEPRYTALEWAAMEGGNSVDDAHQIDEDAFDRIAKRVEVRDLALYRLIVGSNNLMLTKNFLELAKDGKSIPSSYVKGFQAAIEMLDDIVTAGPGYVQMLKVIHNRAKRAR